MADHLRLEIDNTGREHHSLERRDGGDPPGGDMLIRVQRLEDDMKEVKADLKNVRERLSGIDGRLHDMPTKDWMNTRMLAYFGVAIAIIGLMIRFL